jgi:hypothetical protein
MHIKSHDNALIPASVFVSAATGASIPLPSKISDASAIILTFRQCLPSRFLANVHIPSQYIIAAY